MFILHAGINNFPSPLPPKHIDRMGGGGVVTYLEVFMYKCVTKGKWGGVRNIK